MLIVDAKIRSLFTEPPPLFNQMMALQGVLYRELENRRTQRITLNHQANSRVGFGMGAILAAEFIKGKKGFYSFEEVLKKAEK